MGITKIDLRIIKPGSDRSVSLRDAIVDTGASLTWAPKELLEQVGITPDVEMEFRTITGARIRRKAGAAICEVDGAKGPCGVVFAEKDDATVIGVEVLENLGLAVDPKTKKLTRTELLALSCD